MEDEQQKDILHIGVDTSIGKREDMEEYCMCGKHSYPWEFDGHTIAHINTLKDYMRLNPDKFELCIKCLDNVKEHINHFEDRAKMLKDRIEDIDGV